MENKFLKLIEKSISTLSIFIFALMTVIVFAQVVLRYVFDMNIVWADEFSRYGMVWIAFIGATLGVIYGEHTRIDFFVNLLPKSGRIFMEVLNKFLCIFFLAVISYYSVKSLDNLMLLTTPTLQIPTGIVHLVIPITGVIMIVYLFLQAINIIKNRNQNEDEKGKSLI